MTEQNKLTLFILDDQIVPSDPTYVEQELHESKLDSTVLSELLNSNSSNWDKQPHLKNLISFILKSDHFQNNLINLYGFTHPSICLDEIDEGLKPNIVIYDWEYLSESHKQSAEWLKEILNATDAFIFVYSMVRNEIPPFLNKTEFDLYAERFQLLLKGDTRSSVFSSEEFIFQYILSEISKSNKIIVNGIEIEFRENGYLSESSDILYLEKILGRAALKAKLAEGLNTIKDETIEYILKDISVSILLDRTKGLLVAEDSLLMVKKIQVDEKLSAIEVLKSYGIARLKEILEVGIAKA